LSIHLYLVVELSAAVIGIMMLAGELVKLKGESKVKKLLFTIFNVQTSSLGKLKVANPATVPVWFKY